MMHRIGVFAVALSAFVAVSSSAVALRDAPMEFEVSPLRGWNIPGECLQFAFDQSEECHLALNRQGMHETMAGRLDAAIDRFSQILRLRIYPEVYSNRAIAYLKKGDLKRSRQDFNTALGMNPGIPHALDGLARLEMRQKHYKRALALINRALVVVSEEATYLELRAQIHRIRGHSGLAERDEQQAQEIRRNTEDEDHVPIGTTEVK